ncbi:hypothetical protein CR513_35505, partial [Mucuna pruriens]
MFRKVEINIPLLDAIKQVLKYDQPRCSRIRHKKTRPRSSRLGQDRLHLGQTRSGQASQPSSPSRCSPIRSSSKTLSTSAVQLKTTLAPAQLPRLRLGSRSLPKGTDWDSQHTLVNLILSAQAIEGEPPPSTMAIVVED